MDKEDVIYLCVCVCVYMCVCVCVCVTKLLQSCPTLCNTVDCSLPGSSVQGILQARKGVRCNALLQGIFWTQGSNLRLLHLLHWQADSLPLAPPGKPQNVVHPYNGILPVI